MEITPKLSVTEDKIRLLTVKTDMFKTACLTLNVLVPMGEYAAEYAVLSSYLVHSSKKYDSLIKLNSRLEELYGALLSGSISRHGENYRIQLSITCIDDSLTFDGKSVTGAFVASYKTVGGRKRIFTGAAVNGNTSYRRGH